MLLTVFATPSSAGCTSVKNSLIKTGENSRDMVIHNAILDFSNSCKLYKNDSVFSVSFEDLSKYKRIVTNIADGYCQPPKLKCN
jgi:hypothetical protein